MSDDKPAEALLTEIEANTRATATTLTDVAAAIPPSSPDAAAAAAVIVADAVLAAADLQAAAVTAAAVLEKPRAAQRATDGPQGQTTRTTTTSMPQRVTLPSGQVVAAPTSTEEEDRMTAGQRIVNLKWESTQQIIAIGFAAASIAVCMYLIIFGSPEMQYVAFTFLTTMAATINQNYFTRTNHTKVGGVKYEGR